MGYSLDRFGSRYELFEAGEFPPDLPDAERISFSGSDDAESFLAGFFHDEMNGMTLRDLARRYRPEFGSIHHCTDSDVARALAWPLANGTLVALRRVEHVGGGPGAEEIASAPESSPTSGRPAPAAARRPAPVAPPPKETPSPPRDPNAPRPCNEVLAAFPVEPYKDQRNKKDGVYSGCQSHHVIQNAYFVEDKKVLTAICPNYDPDSAPCIPLDDGTNPNTAHGRVSLLQKADNKRYRDRVKDGGPPPTYAEVRADALKHLTAQPEPGLKPAEAECVMADVDTYFQKSCAGKAGGNLQLRVPGPKPRKAPKKIKAGLEDV